MSSSKDEWQEEIQGHHWSGVPNSEHGNQQQRDQGSDFGTPQAKNASAPSKKNWG